MTRALYAIALTLQLLAHSSVLAEAAELEEQVRRIASELRCPVCQNLSVADSPSELAQQMRALITEQLKAGKSPEEIKAYFVAKYGDWVLLAPEPRGLNLLIWVLPFVAAAGGIIFVAFVTRRWARRGQGFKAKAVDPALLDQLRSELEELEFDFQAGKISGADYREIREELEAQVALTVKDLGPLAGRSEPEAKPAGRTLQEKKPPGERRPYGWKLATGGAFLLLFGITLGVLLTQSLRPRQSEMDSITGDLLTGTSRQDIPSLLAQGRSAFKRQDWPQAVRVFKRVLDIDPNQPEAHSYMGLVLAQTGHVEGALMAFDRALESDPNFPLALWGKGMLLYKAKADLPEARKALEKLASLLPQGDERSEVEKTIAEIARAGGDRKKALPRPTRIKGTVSVDSKLEAKVDPRAVLFIIARAPGVSAGPPLAAKKIERPVFPLSYALGPEDSMTPGAALSDKLIISARLDRDGNPLTRQPGDLAGEYRKNPVSLGSEGVDIVIDRVM